MSRDGAGVYLQHLCVFNRVYITLHLVQHEISFCPWTMHICGNSWLNLTLL